jgi:multidrug transporter EmrE-like cation transporter
MTYYKALVLIFITIVFTVYGQLIIKWQVMRAGEFPTEAADSILFLLHLIINPWVISGLMAAFLAALSWMAAMTRLELSYAYPFMSLNFVLVLVLSGMLFQEPITLPKVIGMALIVLGILVGGKG